MIRLPLVLVAAAVSLTAHASVGAVPPSLDSLVRSERQFSALSVEKGMRDAFVTYMAEGGILFRPLPVDGKKLWESRGAVPGTLIWEPSFAEVSAAGDMGYTMGPWEFRLPADTTQEGETSYGHFISVWKMQPEGWRVVADIGIQHDKPERGVGSGDLTEAPVPKPAKQAKTESMEIGALDQALAEATRSKGIGSAFAAAASKNIRLNRDGFFPTVGIDPVRSAYDSLRGSVAFVTQGSGVSSSMDLGYSYGVRRTTIGAGAPSDSGVFLHVWRREDGKKWKLALAVENPL